MSEELKSRMSPEERASRRAALGKAASEKIAKSEQLNFRLDEKSINALQKMAFDNGTPISTMIREWVLARLSQEQLGVQDNSGKAILLLKDISDKVSGLLNDLVQNPIASEQTPSRWWHASHPQKLEACDFINFIEHSALTSNLFEWTPFKVASSLRVSTSNLPLLTWQLSPVSSWQTKVSKLAQLRARELSLQAELKDIQQAKKSLEETLSWNCNTVRHPSDIMTLSGS